MKIKVTPGVDDAEARHWAKEVVRMYISWAKRNGLDDDWSVLYLEDGGAELEIAGDHAALATETGIHRRVRTSPETGLRTSAFAVVQVDQQQTTDEHVRSYVLTPYELATDHRSGRKTSEVVDLLGGHLELITGAVVH